MSEYSNNAWRKVFAEQKWINEAFEVVIPADARHITVEFARHEHKLTEFSGADETSLTFKHGHFMSVYLWSQITGVSVFKP